MRYQEIGNSGSEINDDFDERIEEPDFDEIACESQMGREMGYHRGNPLKGKVELIIERKM